VSAYYRAGTRNGGIGASAMTRCAACRRNVSPGNPAMFTIGGRPGGCTACSEGRSNGVPILLQNGQADRDRSVGVSHPRLPTLLRRAESAGGRDRSTSTSPWWGRIMRDRNGNPIRMNEGVDPRMIGVEVADCKQGNHMEPGRRLRWLRRDLTSASALGRLPNRIARHVGRRRPAA
jgi:hypothetical protein